MYESELCCYFIGGDRNRLAGTELYVTKTTFTNVALIKGHRSCAIVPSPLNNVSPLYLVLHNPVKFKIAW